MSANGTGMALKSQPFYRHKNGIWFRKATRYDAMTLILQSFQSGWESKHSFSVHNYEDQAKWFDSLGDSSVLLIGGYESLEVGEYKIRDINTINRSYTAGWTCFTPYQKKGYGKKLVEAGVDFGFEVLNLHRATAEILETNTASLACAKYAGFEFEGRRKGVVWRSNTWVSDVMMGLTQEVWINLPRVQEMGTICHIINH